MKKIVSFILVLVLIPMLFSSCSYNQAGIESLFTPPKLSDQQNQIYKALEAKVKTNIRLKYPKKGEYTSAFLIKNVDDEPTEEALVFYERLDKDDPNMPIRISVLDQKEGKWVATCNIGVEANEVDKIYFIDSNGKTLILIGFNVLSSTEKLLVLYSYEDRELKEIYRTNCMEFNIVDLDDNGVNELVTITPMLNQSNVRVVTANLNSIDSNAITPLSYTYMDPDVTSYVNVLQGKLVDGRNALYIDGLKGSKQLVTEILALNNSNIDNLIYAPNKKFNLIDKTIRTNSWSMDLDKDGIIEIPLTRPAPGEEDKPKHQQLSFTYWYNYTDKELILVKTSFVDYSMSYMFTIPSIWSDKVTIGYVPEDRELSFYELSRFEEPDSKLLSIRIFKRNEYHDKAEDKGYIRLHDNGQFMYTYKLYETKSETNSEMRLSDDAVVACFIKL